MTRPLAAFAVIAALAIVAAFAVGRATGRADDLAATVRAATLAEVQARLALAPAADHAPAWLAGQDAPAPVVEPTPQPMGGPVEPSAWMPAPVVFWWADVIRPTAERYGVDPMLASIIVLVESGGNPLAESGAGALGMYQVVPRFHPRLLDGDPHDPHHNADVGTAYLADCLRRYGLRDDPDWQRSVERAAACYNGGGGGVANPAAETRAYIRWVGGMWAERHAPTSPTLDAWLAAGGRRLVEGATASMAPHGVLPPSAGGTMGIVHRPRP